MEVPVTFVCPECKTVTHTRLTLSDRDREEMDAMSERSERWRWETTSDTDPE